MDVNSPPHTHTTHIAHPAHLWPPTAVGLRCAGGTRRAQHVPGICGTCQDSQLLHSPTTRQENESNSRAATRRYNEVLYWSRHRQLLHTHSLCWTGAHACIV